VSRIFRGKPGDRVAIDTACSTAQSYQIRLLALSLGPGANFIVPRIVFTPTLSPDAAWSTSAAPAPYRFDPGAPFTLTCGGSLYIESDECLNVGGGYTRPNSVISQFGYEVVTFGTGLNDGIHKANHNLTCSYPMERGGSALFAPIPTGAFDLELASPAGAPAITVTYGIGGLAIPTLLARAAGSRAVIGAANTLAVSGVADPSILIFGVRLPGG
jgi:hypothetical protein